MIDIHVKKIGLPRTISPALSQFWRKKISRMLYPIMKMHYIFLEMQKKTQPALHSN